MREHRDHETAPHEAAAQEPDEPARPGAVARASGRALFGSDLVAPGPSVWPFGPRARQRRAARRSARERAEQRRAGLRRAWAQGQSSSAAGRAGRWDPVAPRRHAAVIAGLAGLVVGLAALSWWAGGDAPSAAEDGAAPAATPSDTPAPSSSDAPTSADESGQRLQLDPVAPIPSDGIAPIVPDPPDGAGTDPEQVPTVPPPQGPPSMTALASPEAAAAGWMAQWCPFDAAESFGAAPSRSQPWMTEHGWETFDPRGDPRAESSWQRTVAAGESAACSRPQARVVPEAPRSADSAIVQVTAERVVTGRDGPYVEPLAQRRIVQRGPDGLWRVDAATRGG